MRTADGSIGWAGPLLNGPWQPAGALVCKIDLIPVSAGARPGRRTPPQPLGAALGCDWM